MPTSLHASTLGRALRPLVVSVLLGVFVFGCASPPVVREVTPAERLRKDSRVGRNLAEKFEPQLRIRTDVDLAIYLRELAQEIASKDDALAQAPIGVLVVEDRNNRRWRNYSLPGNRIYLSSGLLSQFKYENQVAAALAFELAHIRNRHAFTRLDETPLLTGSSESSTEFSVSSLFSVGSSGASADPRDSVDYFGPAGIFAFTEKEYLDSAQVAVDLLYRAGYDSRGLISIWQLYEKLPDNSPFEQTTLHKLQDATRDFIAKYAPLRNPIVRSEAFLKIRKRLEKL